MKKIILCLLLTSANPHIKAQTMTGSDTKDKIIFAVGGEFSKEYLQYVIDLTKKQQPKICFLPTAAADNPYAINYWYELCLGLPVIPSVQRVFVNSSPGQKSFEENLLAVDESL